MVRYRQHGDNQTGCNKGWVARISRLRLLFDGRFKAWNDRHLKALQGMRHRMTAENLRILDTFAGARQGSLIDRLEGVLRAGLYRQTFMGNLGLFLAASTGKI
jgi:hypothetical protein